MKKQYFLKDKKAEIYKDIGPDGADNYGRPLPPQWRPISPTPLWCYSKQLSQDQRYYSYSMGREETRLFVFNYIPGIELHDLISYRGEWYLVTRVDTTDDYKGELFLYARLAVGSEEPEPEEILPYIPMAQTPETSNQ